MLACKMTDSSLRARALLFDMDGTLVDSSANVERAYRWWSNLHRIPVEPILAVQSGRPHREVFAEFAARFGLSLDIDHESKLFADFELHDEAGLRPIPGAPAFLAAAQQGPWALVTSAKRPLADMRMRVSGLPMPPVVITSESIQHGKPDPECFLLAAAALGLPPTDCVVFEDAVAGVEAGRRAGMPVIGIDPALALAHTDLLVPNFLDLTLDYDSAGALFSIRRKNT